MSHFLLFAFLLSIATCDGGTRRKAVAVSAHTPETEAGIVATASMNAQSDASIAHFKTKIQPILAARCQPCHFAGGKMYGRLPFDDPKTIRQLGMRLFTRIKDEKEQTLIRNFLAMASDSTNGGATQLP